MEYHDYLGFRIVPHPLKLVEGGFNCQIFIEKHSGSEITSRKFSASNTFATRDEALRRCVEFGVRVIDGDVEGCTVSDL